MSAASVRALRRCDGVLRRDLLRVGGLTAFGISASQLIGSARAADAAPASAGSARNCILIWLDGGPSHLETFDPKPDVPAEVRGPLEPIATRIPGVFVSECLPRMAERLNQVAVIRSMTSPLGEHNLGTHYVLTGYPPGPALEYPSFHAVAASLRTSHHALPANVAVPDYSVGGAAFSGSGFLNAMYRPFEVGSDPASPEFQVRDLQSGYGLDAARLSRRRQFTESMARMHQGAATVADPAIDRAFRMITSHEARTAFELQQESTAVRQRYGMKSIGQSCLLARRLVERGVPLVTVTNRGWDTHDNLYTRLKEGYTGAKVPAGLIPAFDQALSALLDELQERGLLSETLVVVAGEFGRTPKLNAQGGRDHWPRAFSAVLAGGGVRGGQVIGSSDRTGESPADRPVTPSDLVATIYALLGISPETELRTSDGRPIRLSPHDATVIQEVIS